VQLDSEFFIYGIVFLSALLLAEGIYFLIIDMTRSTVRSPNRRLRMLASGETRESVMLKLKRERASSSELGGFDPIGWFANLVVQTGISRTPTEIAMLMLIVGVVGALAAFVLTFNILIALAGLLGVGLLMPIGVLLILRKVRLGRFSKQLADAIDIMVRSLRAGHPVPTSLGLVSREMPDPCGTEFGLAVDEMTYGLDLPSALQNVSRRVGLQDLRFLVVAVMIQMQVGGNLAEVLAALSKLIRERQKLRAKVFALSSEGRFSAAILTVLPFALAIAVNVVNPRYYQDVWADPIFLPIMAGSVVWMLIGIAVMYKMVNFKV
jgi:tight adherence protein B